MDPLANMFSLIKNAGMAGRTSVELPHSNEKEQVAKILKEKGYLDEVKVFKDANLVGKRLHLDLSFEDGSSKISNIIRVSKPSRRVYGGKKDMKKVLGGYGISIVSTSRGIMDSLEAKRKNLGGEVICKVY